MDSRHRSLENAQFTALMQRGLGAASALRMFQVRKEGGFQPDAASYTALIGSLAEAGRAEQALHLFEELLGSGEAMTLSAFNAGMALYAKRNQLDRVLHLYERMRAAGLRPTELTFSTLIEACCRAFQFQRAQDFFAEMKTHGLQPDAHAYNLLLGHAVRTKKLELAVELYDAMQSDGISASRDTLLLMVEVHARRNDLERAVALTETLLAERWQPSPHALTQLIAACGRLQRVDVALDVFEAIKRAHTAAPPAEMAYSELIALLASRDQIVIARDYLAEMVKVGYAPGRGIFHALINAYARTTQPNGLAEAEALFEQMRAAGLPATEVSCACLMQVYRAHRALPQALRLYETARTLPPSPLLLDALIGLACEAGAHADADRIFKETQALSPPPPLLNSTWLAVAQMYKDAKEPNALRDFARTYGALLKRRAVLSPRPYLAAEIAALSSP